MIREQKRKIELLAPAKDLATAIDAIDCGADAVYIGAGKFGARHSATNPIEDIARVAEYAHLYGVKVYATLNTLLFDDELEAAREQALALIKAGVDALIVQDMAYWQMNLPIPLHASTQTNCVTPEKVKFLEEMGFARAILERSLSKNEIAKIRKATHIELEAFVHGAICVSQSGRCFFSRSTSERSGNRGECSQPCRLEYDLCNDKGEVIIKSKHLLSVRDLDLSARLGEMLDLGISSFKIEGRLKDRAYVRNIVSLYRQLLDREIAKRDDVERSSVGRSTIEFEPNASRTFTRGAGEYLFDGKRRGVASFDTPKAMGEKMGRILRVDRRGVVLDCKHDLATGDGVCFISNGALVGTNVVGIEGERIQLNRYDGVAVGVELFRNYNRLFSQAVERSRVKRTISVDLRLIFREDCIELVAIDETGIEHTASVEYASEEVRDKAKGEEALRRQLSRSGDTMFEVRNIEIENIRFAPMSVVAGLRREALEKLETGRLADYQFELHLASYIDSTNRWERKAQYPSKILTPQDNVTNHLAREFYTACGVEEIAEGLDCRATTEGEEVVISDYCIRREIGECLKERPRLKGELYLERGTKRYRLDFDCKACQMRVVDLG
ncbi:MAG: U32 family peptidase [Alistipes sp.]|nr:U32 family peptidase [Alistipes sp.]